MKKFKKETIAAKAGIGSDMHHGSIVPPLYLSSNFEYKELGKEQEYEYTRETNPSSCLLYTSPSPRDRSLSRMPSSA